MRDHFANAAPAAVEGVTRAEAIRTLAFWTIAAAMYLAPLTIVGMLILHQGEGTALLLPGAVLLG